MNIYFII